MTKLPDEMTLGAEDEASRLWTGAREARPRAENDLVALCEALDLGIRAAEILVGRKLQPLKDRFPATVALQLNLPDLEVDTYRDAVAVPKSLQFIDMIDLLGEDELKCVSPGMHRGWEDRWFACRRSRGTAREIVGVTLDEATQDDLLVLEAYRNRIFRYPPPVKIRPAQVLKAYGSLETLVEKLAVS